MRRRLGLPLKVTFCSQGIVVDDWYRHQYGYRYYDHKALQSWRRVTGEHEMMSNEWRFREDPESGAIYFAEPTQDTCVKLRRLSPRQSKRLDVELKHRNTAYLIPHHRYEWNIPVLL
jgi:hypothetical protein